MDDALRRDLDRLVRGAQREGRVPGVSAAVAHRGEVVWSVGVGLADVESGEETSPEHQHRIGSVTKTFTAVAVMRLRDEGELDLDDPLETYVAGGPSPSPTIRRLLAHLSGIQREVPNVDWEAPALPDRDALLASLGDAELVLEPARHWHYSNLAFALLGEVIEAVTATPVKRHLDETLLRPLGLGRTTWRRKAPAATGYMVEPYVDRVRPEGELELAGAAAAGDLWSTTGDLCRWGAFLCDPDPAILAPETVDEMHAPQSMTDPDRWTLGWGLGIAVSRREERIFGGHGGGMPGFITGFQYVRPEKVVAVALANGYADMPSLAHDLAGRAADHFEQEPEPWRPGEATPPELESVLGRWWSEGEESIFSWRDGKLEARGASDAPARDPTVFEPEGGDVFRAASGRERGERLHVIRDEAGDAVKLVWATYPFYRSPRTFG